MWCLDCAVNAGTHPCFNPQASKVACDFFCALRVATQGRVDLPHVHWDKPSGKWSDYEEPEGLVDGRRIRPDSFEDMSNIGGAASRVYLFHGNRWHGYPPGHPEFNSSFVRKSKTTGESTTVYYKDLYEKTKESSKAYVDAGYEVYEIWEHEFKEWKRCPCPIERLVHRFRA